jgi:hypothetical protein
VKTVRKSGVANGAKVAVAGDKERKPRVDPVVADETRVHVRAREGHEHVRPADHEHHDGRDAGGAYPENVKKGGHGTTRTLRMSHVMSHRALLIHRFSIAGQHTGGRVGCQTAPAPPRSASFR